MKRTSPHRDREAERCTFIRAQRATHLLIQIYDRELRPAGLTNAQFGLLAYLSHSSGDGPRFASASELGRYAGLHRQALHRELRLLVGLDLVTRAANPDDPSLSSVAITDKGRAKFQAALPLWSGAKSHIRALLGERATLELDGLLEFTLTKLESGTPIKTPRVAVTHTTAKASPTRGRTRRK